MKKIPLLQGKGLLIELPEGAENTSISDSDYFDKVITSNQHLTWNIDNGMLDGVSLPPGNWRIVSTLADLTEQQAHGLVDWDEDELYYKVYDAHPITHDNGQTTIRPGCLDAIESFHSAILAEGYTFLPPEYPDISDPKFYDEPYDGTGFYQEIYSGAIEDYHEAQSRVLCRERTLILRRV